MITGCAVVQEEIVDYQRKTTAAETLRRIVELQHLIRAP
jgi:hypothetical protein